MLQPLLEFGLPENARIGVAVSGGADSTALLFLLQGLSPGYELSLIHTNHGLRGEESDGDEQFCRDLAARLGLPFHSVKRPPIPGANLEESARDARLQFFLHMIETKQVDYVATAHTRNDQAETVLFRLLRGASIPGMAGIRRRSGGPGGRILRPLLDVTRAELTAYLESRGEAWREDSSNASPQFARNRIRLELLPQLERDWNPELTRGLARTARLAYDEEEFWNAYIARTAAAIFHQKGNTAVVAASNLLSPEVEVAVARRLVRWAIDLVKGDTKQIEYQHVEAVLDLCRMAEGHGRVILPGVDVMRSFEWLRFARYAPDAGEDRLAIRNQRMEMAAPGEAVAADGSLIRLELVRAEENDTVKSTEDWECGAEGPPRAVLLRSWKPGDQYHPAGFAGPQKLKSLFQEFRIPLWDRGTWPIITVGNEIIWARQFGPAISRRRMVSGERAARLRIMRIV